MARSYVVVVTVPSAHLCTSGSAEILQGPYLRFLPFGLLINADDAASKQKRHHAIPQGRNFQIAALCAPRARRGRKKAVRSVYVVVDPSSDST